MNFIRSKGPGILFCLILGTVAFFLGLQFPAVGGPVFAIIIGAIVALALKKRQVIKPGIGFTSKYVLQAAVVMLGFGLDLNTIAATGLQSLPIIISTIMVALVVAFVACKAFGIPGRISTLIGVGSSICGGSAIAATAPVIKASDGEIAQAIATIFFYNVIAAILFPAIGTLLGFSTADGLGFGIFAGTAVNDTSSVTAAAATWDSIYGLGTQTLDIAVTVKLTRTLAIIPITLALAFWVTRKQEGESGYSIGKAFPKFIALFVAASCIMSLCTALGVSAAVFAPLKDISKFLIVVAMAAIGLNTNIVELVRTSKKPLLLGLVCWACITVTSVCMQHILGLM